MVPHSAKIVNSIEYFVEICIVKGKKRNCVAGDTKAHTYPNGIYQTGISYDNPNDKSKQRGSKNTPAVIEFIGKVIGKNKELNKYNIKRVIVYDNKKVKE